jgi:hypothetical protein
MPSKKLDQDLFFSPPGTHLYNIHFKSGVLSTRAAMQGSSQRSLKALHQP